MGIKSSRDLKTSNHYFISRDLSWLRFNERVMLEAKDQSIPLLERLKFLSIYYSNLDEFFMVRVGSLMHRSKFIPGYRDEKTGLTTDDEIKQILQTVSDQQKLARSVYDGLMEDFKNAGIERVDFKHLSKSDEIFTKKIFVEYKDLLSPRIVDEQHPMPFVDNCETYSILYLQKNTKMKVGLIPLSRLPKYLSFTTESGTQKVILVSELINYYSQSIFKKFIVKEKALLRVTRNADVFFEDYDPDKTDSRDDMQKILKKRKRAMPVRLQIFGKPSAAFYEIMKSAVKLSSRSIFINQIPFEINFSDCISVDESMKYASRKPLKNVNIGKGNYFKYLAEKDLLLAFPFQSITPFIEMVYEAADDPDVESISITLYRLAASSRLAAALAYAADRGKDVLCLLELRARFDEQNNIDYSEVLEEAGCSVIYGLERLKVHSKLLLIKKKNPDGSMSCITQLGTGNYNEVTSEAYTDISIITSNAAIGRDADEVFKALAMGEVPPDTPELLMAPEGFKKKLLLMLDEEMAKGPEGRVSIKVNALNDIDVMNKFIECSKAGVKIELFIRGICCLKPGLAGITDNITVKSIVGRYLEHSRIYVFGKGETQKIFVGSGDLLNRNTQRRVEAFIQVSSPDIKADVLEIMNSFRDDINNSWIMQPDGLYQKLPSAAGRDNFDRLYDYFAKKDISFVEKKPEKKPRRVSKKPSTEKSVLDRILEFFGFKR